MLSSARKINIFTSTYIYTFLAKWATLRYLITITVYERSGIQNFKNYSFGKEKERDKVFNLKDLRGHTG